MTSVSINNRFLPLLLAYALVCGILFTGCQLSENKYQAPTPSASGWLTIQSNACYFNPADADREENKIVLDYPEQKEAALIDYLMQFTGLPQNFKLYRGNVSTALATTVNNERLIVYNKELLAALDKMDNSYWATIFILAHEIGHHLAYNISDTVRFFNAELQADKFAGSLLYNMGADSNQVLAALNAGLISDSKQNQAQRIQAAKEGWHLGYKYRYQSVVPPSIDDELRIQEFDERTLVFNSYWDPLIGSTTADTLRYLDEEAGRIKHLKGIILEVQKNKLPRPDLAQTGFIQLNLIVMLTHADHSADQYFPENEKFEFIVDYEPIPGTAQKKDVYKFFTQGRRMEFDIVFLRMCDGCPYNISKAKAIYNSY